MTARTPKPEIVTRIVADITAEIGSWGLGQLNDQGLVDVVWDHYEPFHRLDDEHRDAWMSAVRAELGWEPAA